MLNRRVLLFYIERVYIWQAWITTMSSFRAPPRKGENYELSVDLNSEYRDKRKDAIKRVIASMTVGKGELTIPHDENQG